MAWNRLLECRTKETVEHVSYRESWATEATGHQWQGSSWVALKLPLHPVSLTRLRESA